MFNNVGKAIVLSCLEIVFILLRELSIFLESKSIRKQCEQARHKRDWQDLLLLYSIIYILSYIYNIFFEMDMMVYHCPIFFYQELF